MGLDIDYRFAKRPARIGIRHPALRGHGRNHKLLEAQPVTELKLRLIKKYAADFWNRAKSRPWSNEDPSNDN